MLSREKSRQLETALTNLKSPSSIMYETLVEVRTKLLMSPAGTKAFIEGGGIGHLVMLLQNQNEEIACITLSCLGDCCVTQEGRVQFKKCGGIDPLIQILKKIKKDNIMNQVVYLMGNLFKDEEYIDMFHKKSVIPVLISALRTSDTTGETKKLVVRAIGFMADTQPHIVEILAEGVLHDVFGLLGTDDNESFIEAVVKAIAKLTDNLTERDAEQVEGHDWKVFESLVSLLKNTSLCIDAFVSMTNLSKIPSVMQILKKAGFDPVHAALSLFTCKSLKRESIKETSAPQILLNSLAEEGIFYSKLIHRLFSLKYPSLKILFEKGLARVLITRLKSCIERNKADHASNGQDVVKNQFNSRRSKLVNWATENCITDEEAERLMRERHQLFSPFSFSQWSWDIKTHGIVAGTTKSTGMRLGTRRRPSSLPGGVSTKKSRHMFDLRENSNCCSVDSMSECPTMDQEPRLSFLVDTEKVKNERIHCLLLILLKGCNIDFYMDGAMLINTMHTLVDYLVVTNDPDLTAETVLNNITGNVDNFEVIVEHRFVLDIYSKLCLRIHEECETCDQGMGIGESVVEHIATVVDINKLYKVLADSLLSEDFDRRNIFAFSIPFIVRNYDELKNLLIDSGGLKIIFEALEMEDSEALKYAVVSLWYLTLEVSLVCTIKEKDLSWNETPKTNCCNWENSPKDVEFQLDAGSSISANRQILCEKCPVFDAMFKDSFKESKQSVIRVQDISVSCLGYVIHFQFGCNCDVTNNVCLDTALEVITASNKFLLPELHVKMCKDVVTHHINAGTVLKILEWISCTVQEETAEFQFLCTETVKYLLVGKMDLQTRVQTFQSLIESVWWTDIQERIQNIISKKLNVISCDFLELCNYC